MHTHVVFFWLKEPDNQAHRDTFAAGLAHLVKDPNVKGHKIGQPAATQRDVVENGYSFALIAEFDTLAAHDAYQVGTHHDDFLAQCAALWSDVKVFDVST